MHPQPFGATDHWTARRFFDLLRHLGSLRVVSVSGPSVFEARCEIGPQDFSEGSLNIITPQYHWNLSLDRFRHLRSVTRVHPKTGEVTAFFELRDDCSETPFLRIYLSGGANGQQSERLFADVHPALQHGVDVVLEELSPPLLHPRDATPGLHASH